MLKRLRKTLDEEAELSQEGMQCDVAVAERCESEVHAKETLRTWTSGF